MVSDHTCKGPGGHSATVPQLSPSQARASGAFAGGPGGKAISAISPAGSYRPVWRKKGVLAGTIAPGVVRVVTHHDVDDEGVERAAKALAAV